MYRFVVTAITRGARTIIPRGDDGIQAGDSIFVFAHQKDMPAIQYLLKLEETETKRRTPRAFILGGGRIGLRIALELERLRFDVRLVDHDETRCEKLSSYNFV